MAKIVKEITSSPQSPQGESLPFKTGEIYTLNKIQEWIANGENVAQIEGHVIRMIEKIFRDLEKYA